MTDISVLIEDAAQADNLALFERLNWLDGEETATKEKAKALGHDPQLIDTTDDPEQYWACILCGDSGVAAMSAEPDAVIYTNTLFHERCSVGFKHWWTEDCGLQAYVEEMLQSPSVEFKNYAEHHLAHNVFCKGGWGVAGFCATNESSIDRANARVAAGRLDKAGIHYETLDGDIYIDTENREAVELCFGMAAELVNHPALEDDVVSQVELEDREEAWEVIGKRAIEESIKRLEIVALCYPGDLNQVDYSDEQEEDLVQIYMDVAEHDGHYVTIDENRLDESMTRMWLNQA